MDIKPLFENWEKISEQTCPCASLLLLCLLLLAKWTPENKCKYTKFPISLWYLVFIYRERQRETRRERYRQTETQSDVDRDRGNSKRQRHCHRAVISDCGSPNSEKPTWPSIFPHWDWWAAWPVFTNIPCLYPVSHDESISAIYHEKHWVIFYQYTERMATLRE